MNEKKSNKILEHYYGKMYDLHGRETAATNLKGVIVKGLRLLVDMPNQGQGTSAESLVKRVRQGAPAQLVESISAEVQDGHKIKRKQYLVGVEVNKDFLLFLPDVEIDNTQENINKWTKFLAGLDPRCRRNNDPVTGLNRIPFRQGAWLYDLVLPADKQVNVIPEIRTIEGNLVYLGRKVGQGPKLAVEKRLVCSVGLLQQDNKFISSIGQGITVYAKDDMRSVEELQLTPDDLLRFKLEPGKNLSLGDKKLYAFTQKNGSYMLEEVIRVSGKIMEDAIYVWGKNQWEKAFNHLPMELLNKVRVRLNKMATFLGLGKGFLDDHTDHIHDNINRLLIFLNMVMGNYPEGGLKSPSTKDSKHLIELDGILTGLKTELTVFGQESKARITEIMEQVEGLLSRLDEKKLRAVASTIGQDKKPIELSSLRHDLKYLAHISQPGYDFDKLLGTPGRTIVFLNNNCQSKAARTKITGKIADMLTILREVVGVKESEAVMVDMLKWYGDDFISRLRKSAKSQSLRISELKKRMDRLMRSTPRKTAEDILQSLNGGNGGNGVTKDKSFLLWMVQAQGETLEEFLEDAESGVDMLRRILYVNLKSLVYEDIKRDNPSIRSMTPSQIVAHLVDKLNYLEPIVKTYNNV